MDKLGLPLPSAIENHPLVHTSSIPPPTLVHLLIGSGMVKERKILGCH